MQVMGLVRKLTYELRSRTLDALVDQRVAAGMSLASFVMSIVLRPFLPRSSLSLLCRSHRILFCASPHNLFSAWLNRMIERVLRRVCAEGGLVESVAAAHTEVQEIDLCVSRTAGLVLKAPRREGDHIVERGVLLLKNTECLDSFRRCVEMARILERYTLILEPSWSAYANPRLLSFCMFRDHPIVVMSPCQADHQFLERLQSNLRPVPAGASDWVDPQVFHPLEGQDKRFDAVMIARWTLMKRHHLLFRALQRIGDPSYRVAFVASNIPGDTDRHLILSMIDAYHLASQITVFEDLTAVGVNEILNQSKVNLLLSHREGSNRSLFEGFFAGVPGLAFSNNLGIPLRHFTPQTGWLIAEHELPSALLHFRDHWSEFDPRPWALANIAPNITTSRLNDFLRQLAQQRHEPWTQDIVCKCNCPELRYYPDERAGHGFPTMDDVLARFPAPARGQQG